MTFGEAVRLVRCERARQETIRADLPRCSDPDLAWPLKLSALVEEVGEVARALNDDSPPAQLQSELVQVAAVAMAWIQSFPGVPECEAGPEAEDAADRGGWDDSHMYPTMIRGTGGGFIY